MAKYRESYNWAEQNKLPPISALIYGAPKNGKTWLAASAGETEDTLLWNIEGRVAYVPQFPNLMFFPSRSELCTLNHIRQLDAELTKNPDHGIKNILVDTFDALINLKLIEMEEDKATALKNVNPKSERERIKLAFDERGALNEAISKILNKFKRVHGCNIICTCHQRPNEKTLAIEPTLSAGMFKEVNKYFDNILYAKRVFNEKEEEEIHVYTIGNDEFYAASSSIKGHPLPLKLINPTWKDITGGLQDVDLSQQST